MQKGLKKFQVGLLFAIGTALFIILVGALLVPPRYTAQATFSVNWGQMSVDPKDQNQQKARQEFDSALSNLKFSNEFITQLCAACNIPNEQSGQIISKLQRHLRITPAGTTDDRALYRVQFVDDNQDIALKGANLGCVRFVNRINLDAKVGSGVKALQSFGDNANAQDKEENLRDELARLLQQQDQEFSSERQARINEIREELDQTDLDKAQTAFETFGNIGGVFSNPAKVEQPGIVQMLRPAYAGAILLLAIVFGLGAGIVGMLFGHVLFSPRNGVPPVLQTVETHNPPKLNIPPKLQ